MANWTSVSDSEHPWERDALAFIRNGLPASSAIQVWSNFEFMAEGGAIYEVDTLLVGPWGAFLIEIKSLPGVITSQAGSWIWRDGTTYKTRDNPLPLANRKCKALKSLLERQAAFKRAKVQVPFIEPLIFCSDENNVLQLQGPQANGVCLRDRPDGSVPGIIGAISRREAPGLRSFQRAPITKDQIRAFVTGVEQVSLNPVQKVRKAGDYVLDGLFHDSPLGTYQEWLGHHVRIKSGPRLIRVYLEGLQGETERSTLRRAAEREFQILERMEHPGILRVDTLTETESGPALVFRWQEGAQRLDHYLAGLAQPLTADAALDILRQITEAIAYAHRKKVIHRGLSPQAIIVIPGETGSGPAVQISSWNLGFIDGGTSSGATRTRFSTSLHAGQFVEDEATVFFAPEAVSGQNIEGEELDSFSLGALAYYLFSGKPPADSVLDLDQKLRQRSYLDLCAVQNGVVPALENLIRHTACSDRSLRYSPDEVLERIDEVWDEMTAPDTAEVVDPRTAKAGELLEHGYRVIRDLGTGSCSKVLLVESPKAERQVLKVASKPEYSDRLNREFETIEKIRHPNVVQVFKCLSFDGITGFTMEPAFSSKKTDNSEGRESSLARRLKEDGPLDLALLQRFGVELLQTIDELERLGISHRDIKPDNLGIRSVKKGPLQLVLFDFSLTTAPAEDIRLGTPPYLDPFLSLRKSPRWDHHAERFGAAMTLHEMACGSGVFPVWGDGGSSPHLIDAEVSLRPELFPESLREGLVEFFCKALARDVKGRFDNTEEMLKAWRHIFEKIDQPALTPTTTEQVQRGDKPSLAEILKTTTPDMQLVLLGLSVRLLNVLDKLEVVTIADLLRYPIGRIKRMRGVGYKTSQEAVELYQALHERFPDIESRERVDEAAKDASSEPELASVDLIARGLIQAAGRLESTEREIQERFLGWKTPEDDPSALRWPSQTDLGEQVQVTRARVGQIVTSAREKWLKSPSITRLREAIHATLLSQGGVTTHSELIRLMLLLRGSTLSEPDSLRMASIATRAAVEAERQLQSPRFIESRRQGVLFISVDPAYVDFARQLGTAGEDLASRDPLPTASRVIETLGAIPFPDTGVENVRPPDHSRRAHLAASVSGKVCVNSRLELYPPGLSAERALALSRSALFGVRELKLEEIHSRVASRYPMAESLPGRPQLDRLLEQVGFPLQWDERACNGAGAYQSKHVAFSTGNSYTIGSRRGTIDLTGPGQPVSEEVAEAQRLEDKLTRARAQGSYLVLTIDPKYLNDAANQLERIGAKRLNASELFLTAMKDKAADLGVPWEVVLEADAAEKGSADWTRLQELIRRSMPGVLEPLRNSNEDILLTDAGLFARYGRMNELDALRNDTGTQSGPHSLWLLVPGHGAATTPTLCGEAVPISNEAQFEQLTPQWARNHHRGGVA
ncbi:MAG: BREX system serine/threonine kinase PglW [Verrucomicrobia bacterium]|nr:MAG: BREX system serine/threonine kinase PglW [Verrucomicrobiota bacterium]